MVKAPGHKRLSIILAVAAYVLTGIPVWWYTTSIPRPALPHATMQQLDAALTNATVLLPVAIHLYIVHPDGGAGELDADSLAGSLLQDLQAHAAPDSPTISQVSVVQEVQGHCHHTSINSITTSANDFSLPCLYVLNQLQHSGQASISDLDPASLDNRLHSIVDAANGNVPGHIIVLCLPGQTQPGQVLVVGQHRHAWTWFADQSQLNAALTTGRHKWLVPALSALISPGPGKDAVHAAKQLPISAAGQTVLMFTLANGHTPSSSSDPPAHPSGRPSHFSWEFGGFQAAYIQPLVHALSMLMNVHVQSQVRLHTTSKVVARWNKKHSAYSLKQQQLPFFIDSDWGLDFGLDAGVAGNQEVTDGASGQAAVTCSPGSHTRDGTCAWGPDSDAHEQQYTPAHVLHMVLYVPPASQQPLRVKVAGGELSGTNSYWMPAWGAVHVLPELPVDVTTPHGSSNTNSSALDDLAAAQTDTLAPPGEADSRETPQAGADANTPSHAGTETVTGAGGPQQQVLGEDKMHRFAEAVVGSLRALLGLSAGPQLGPGSTQGVHVLASDVGVASWEVDRLVRSRVSADIASSARVLGSFSRLAQTLPNLAMPDLIGQHVSQAIQSLRAAPVQAAKSGNYWEAAVSSREAHGAAEQAFSHPAILAQLSFPDSHKVGVYLPFFLPAMLPVVLALASEGKRYIKRLKEYAHQVAAAAGIPPGLSVEELDQLHMMRTRNNKQPVVPGTGPGRETVLAGPGRS